MKTYLKYSVVLLFAVLTACKKDSMPEASAPVLNNYGRMDNPSNEVDHQIYLFYQETKVPVFYSDTISTNPLNVLNLNYQLAGPSSSYIYTYAKKKADLLSGIAFVKNQLLPALGPKIKPYSFSLLDTVKTVIVYSPDYSFTTNYNVLPGLTTFGIAGIPRIATMTPAELVTYKADIFISLLTNPLNSSGLLKDFSSASAGFYSKYAYPGAVNNDFYLEFKDKREYGFILDGYESEYGYSTPTEFTDLTQFLTKVLTVSQADFEAVYGNYPLVMSKYNLLKEAITTLGFDLTKI